MLMTIILFLTGEMKSSHKAPKLKVGDRFRIIKYKNSFSKGFTKTWSREIFFIDFVLKTNPRKNNTKDLNEEKVIKREI